jgi:hypothetical protein
MLLLVQQRTREIAVVVEVDYDTATISSWVQETRNGFRQDFPVFTHALSKTQTITIPAYTDSETIYPLQDNNIYRITDVRVTASAGRNQEIFSILAMASPSPRILYGLGVNDLMANLLRVKRGLFPQPEWCMTCMGLGEYPEGTTCPECGGYKFAGPNATWPLVDFHGRNVGLSRYDGETDEAYARRVWARTWDLIPTKSEIERFFTHFMHVLDPVDLLVWDIPNDDEPVFYVAVNPEGLGARALWQAGNAHLDYDGLVERACPAGVNGYFAWLLRGFEDEGDDIDSDDWSSPGGDADDVYGNVWQGSWWMDCFWLEFDDWCSENELDDFEGYEDGDDIAAEAPALWTEVSGIWEAEEV